MEPMTITIKGYKADEMMVKPSGTSGRVYVPKSWVGKKVKVILLEPLENEAE